MYEEMGCFDPNAAAAVTGSTSNSNCSVEEISEFHLSPQDTTVQVTEAMQLQFHDQVHLNAPCDQIQSSNNFHLIHQMVHDPSGSTHVQSNWDSGCQDFVNAGPSSTTHDLLSHLQLPRCSVPPSLLPNLSISFANLSFSDVMAASSSVAYDPLFHLNFPPQPPFIQEQNQSLPNGLRNGWLLGMEDQIDGNGGVMYADGSNHGQFDSEILEFNTDTNCKERGSGKMKAFPTERERRVHFKDKFMELKHLIPSPSKGDRASIVGDAIEYIKELLRTIEEFKLLVERKRQGKHRSKRARIEEGVAMDDPENKLVDQSFNQNSSLRCSWLRRKSKVTEVDVRIIDDEVIIKLIQKKKINCLLLVSKVLDQLHLELHHVAGGQIGEHYSFLFNTKIYEGSSVYASAIADALMEVIEQQYMSAIPTNDY